MSQTAGFAAGHSFSDRLLVERALVLVDPQGEVGAKVDRLYFGAEFCCWAFPAVAEILAVQTRAERLGLAFSLLTPVLADPWVPRLRESLEQLRGRLRPEDEVVISDLGSIALVRECLPETRLVIGRALSGQKRGPRILDLNLSPEQLDYFRQGSWYSSEAVELLHDWGVARVELDNLLQSFAPLPHQLSGSLHFPYALVTSSRNCPFRGSTEPGPCRPRCGEVFTLKTGQTEQPLFQAGNSQFLCHSELPEELGSLGIDRLVEHPSLPR